MVRGARYFVLLALLLSAMTTCRLAEAGRSALAPTLAAYRVYRSAGRYACGRSDALPYHRSAIGRPEHRPLSYSDDEPWAGARGMAIAHPRCGRNDWTDEGASDHWRAGVALAFMSRMDTESSPHKSFRTDSQRTVRSTQSAGLGAGGKGARTTDRYGTCD